MNVYGDLLGFYAEYGDEIIFRGEFLSPKKRSNYKGFDYSNYLKTLKIYGTVSVENVKPTITILQSGGVAKEFGILDLYKYCHNKGTGWMMIDYETHKKISHLFCAKYKTRNPWEVDIFNASLIKKIAYNTGLSVNLGNNDGKYTTIDGDVVSFLGIEDVYGNTQEYLEGIHGYRSPNGVVVYIYDGLKPTVSDSS